MPDLLPKIICIVGETATGKTAIAIEIAERCNGEIINADSMQVYRGMDIGTAKPTIEERKRVPIHLVDVTDPKNTYSAGRFWEDARKAINNIKGRNHLPIVAGGTGLYIKTLTHGLIDAPAINAPLREKLRNIEMENPGYLINRVREIDPETADRLSSKDQIRLIRAIEVHESSGMTLSEYQKHHRFGERNYNTLKIGLRRDPSDMQMRIEQRIRAMLESGFENEVRLLMESGVNYEDSSMAAVGYREMMKFISGVIDIETVVAEIIRGTKRLAKRQRTWFRADKDITWFQLPDDKDRLMESISNWLYHDSGASIFEVDKRP